MERETFISGYCRQVDGSRTVSVEAEDRELTQADCLFEGCCYAADCAVAGRIREFLEQG